MKPRFDKLTTGLELGWTDPGCYSAGLTLASPASSSCRLPLPDQRLAKAMNSPTMPRRNSSTVTTKIAPWITSTHSPKVAR